MSSDSAQPPRRPHVLWIWLPVVAQMIVIFAASAVSIPPTEGFGFSLPDTLTHIAAYLVLGACFVRALASARLANVTPGVLAWSVVWTTLYGASDEFHQRFVPGRVSELRDLRNDLIGAVIAAFACWAWSIMTRARRESREQIPSVRERQAP